MALWGMALGLLASVVQAQPFEQNVTAFDIVGLEGYLPNAFPFLGGFNNPRPQWIDLDGDGDLDLVVQEERGQLMVFENDEGRLRLPSDEPAFGLSAQAVGEWVRFADLDGDGFTDLLAEQPISRVQYYAGDASGFDGPALPVLTAAADTLFLDRQNVPALADLDCDGLPDLFMASADTGTLLYYQNQGRDGPNAPPRFAFVTDRYQNICVGPEELCGTGSKQATARHGASALTFADYDADGDLDLFWGDFFTPGLILFENTGTCAAPQFTLRTDPFPLGDPLETSGHNLGAFGDYDGDGDLDLLVGVLGGAFSATRDLRDNLYYYERTTGGYQLRTRRFLATLDVGAGSIPAVGDIDGDGDADLILGGEIDPAAPTTGPLILLRIRPPSGPPSTPTLHKETLAGVLDSVRFNVAPALGDLDADGDLDLLAGGFDGSVALSRNDGQGAFSLIDSAFVAVPRGTNATPALGDLDADGDFDLLLGEASGTLNYFRNDGTPQAPMWTLVTEQFLGFDAEGRSAPALYDLDADGDLDLFVGTDRSGIFFFRNDGTPQAPQFVPAALDLPTTAQAAPAFGDLDGDGDGDLFLGSRRGGLFYFENTRLGTARRSPRPEDPIRLTAAPNPFREATVLHLSLPAAAAVRLALYDTLGRLRQVLHDGFLSAGRHRLPLDGTPLPAGIYFCRLTLSGAPSRPLTLVRLR